MAIENCSVQRVRTCSRPLSSRSPRSLTNTNSSSRSLTRSSGSATGLASDASSAMIAVGWSWSKSARASVCRRRARQTGRSSGNASRGCVKAEKLCTFCACRDAACQALVGCCRCWKLVKNSATEKRIAAKGRWMAACSLQGNSAPVIKTAAEGLHSGSIIFRDSSVHFWLLDKTRQRMACPR